MKPVQIFAAVSLLLACGGVALEGQQPRQPEASTTHWSFRPLNRPAIPAIQDPKSRIQNPIDRILLAALRKKSIIPAQAVDRRRLIRRVMFDLVGLPPRPEEVDAFVTDADPKAYEKLVDRLLASPHFGERWGRHWLDVARYADSNGSESDQDRNTAYHYRDFVIRAFNQDLPFDTFVRWQLAGDEYEPDNALAVAATGFIAAGPYALLPDNLLEEERIRERYNELDDIVSTTGVAFLGLTVACARCHDHKYDPIPQRDYYRMLAAFHAGARREVGLLPREELAKRSSAEAAWRKERDTASNLLKRVENELKVKDEASRKALTAEQRVRLDELAAELRSIEARRPPGVPTVYAYADISADPADAWLLDRGDFRAKRERVELGFLSTLCRTRQPAEYWSLARSSPPRTDTTYQRRALADWITDTKDGAGALLARVIVNRLWQGHFGEGIVRTPNDFGRRSDRPSHPELVEHLASELVRGGWRLKPIHRAIVLSDAYRRDTTFDARSAKIDPDNRLLWRRKPRRLESEIFRDSMLWAAGTLNAKMYGPAFRPPIQAEAILARNVKDPYPSDAKENEETRRRSVYLFHKRVVPYPLLQAFDCPDAAASAGRRNVTTVPTQALAVLNEPFVRLRASEFARRLQKEAGDAASAQVERGYRIALGRAPSMKEREMAVGFLTARAAARAERDRATAAELALTDFAQVLFGLNEFVYVD